MIKTPFIIDTDVGIDDAIALFMVLARPEIELQAITTVFGNVSLAQATHNASIILNLVEAAAPNKETKLSTGPIRQSEHPAEGLTPSSAMGYRESSLQPEKPPEDSSPFPVIYRGNARPLLQYEPDRALEVHGSDGLGGMSGVEPNRTVETEQASLALIRLIRQKPGQITLLTLGPLTNIALAIRLAPEFLKNIKRLVMMAGAVDGRGNTSPPAEFNIASDPEAAKIVFDACRRSSLQPQLISWETTLAHPLSLADWESLIAGDSAAAQFVQGMTKYVWQRIKPRGDQSFLWPDPLAAAVAIWPDIVLKQESRYVEVESGQNLARGQTIVDYRPRSSNLPNVQIVREIDSHRFKELLRVE